MTYFSNGDINSSPLTTMSEESVNLAERLKTGPKEGVEYPVHVAYCGNCTMPIEVSSADDGES